MENENSPVEVDVAAPAVESNDVDNISVLEDRLAAQLRTQEPSEPQVEESIEEEMSEEVSESDEIADMSTDDESPVEAEDDVEDDEEVTPESDLEVFDEESLADGLFPTPDGPKTWAQIQSELGQSKAASKKSREASEQLKELETMRAELQQKDEFLKNQYEAKKAVPALAQKEVEVRQLQERLQMARNNGDRGELAWIKDQLDVAVGQYRHIESQVTSANEQARNQHLTSQVQYLKDNKLEHLVSDEKSRDQLGKYVESFKSETAYTAANNDAVIMMWAEKARQWDDSQKAGKGKKLIKKNSSKSLNAANQGGPTTAQKRKSVADEAIKNGDVDAFAARLAAQM